ncbi:hypothetical protein OHA72_46200 [Dactylosporangium sp. NBC_01737]|uniref:esterase/lipase family protein n=1 Tax=Dactylosporangium sp. NBC_01737 TaxID=2975959 RepID=UPI002E13F744|nr:hypothetical protein OHA72_46200 [Dactylosporangium sp. NBC_01737]
MRDTERAIVFVHGTGVRGRAYSRSFQQIRSQVEARPGIGRLSGCFWGQQHGARLAGELSIPDYKRLRGGRRDAGEEELALWAALYTDPWYELRLLRYAGEPAGELPPGAVPPAAALRAQIDGFVPSDKLRASLARPFKGVAARAATRLVDRRRGAISDLTNPAAGDILLYQARGEHIRAAIRQAIADTRADRVTLLAHSLGGIAAVDLLVMEDIPEVDRLVTVGSQAPYSLRDRRAHQPVPARPAAGSFSGVAQHLRPARLPQLCRRRRLPAGSRTSRSTTSSRSRSRTARTGPTATSGQKSSRRGQRQQGRPDRVQPERPARWRPARTGRRRRSPASSPAGSSR